MASRGPFDRVWAQLRATALRPAPAAVYLVLLAAAWPAYRLWSVAPASRRSPVAAPALATPAAPDAPLELAPDVPTLVRIPTTLLPPGARPARVALTREGRAAWSAPLAGVDAGDGAVLVLLEPGAAPAVLELLDARDATLFSAPLAPARGP